MVGHQSNVQVNLQQNAECTGSAAQGTFGRTDLLETLPCIFTAVWHVSSTVPLWAPLKLKG